MYSERNALPLSFHSASVHSALPPRWDTAVWIVLQHLCAHNMWSFDMSLPLWRFVWRWLLFSLSLCQFWTGEWYDRRGCVCPPACHILTPRLRDSGRWPTARMEAHGSLHYTVFMCGTGRFSNIQSHLHCSTGWSGPIPPHIVVHFIWL